MDISGIGIVLLGMEIVIWMEWNEITVGWLVVSFDFFQIRILQVCRNAEFEQLMEMEKQPKKATTYIRKTKERTAAV